MLEVRNIESGYGAMQVLWGADLVVREGTITSLLGPNGAGKSTLLWTVFGEVPALAGEVRLDGRDVTRVPPHEKVDLGIGMVPEGKHLFPDMTVRENLLMGAYRRSAHDRREENLARVHALFPVLEERAGQKAGSLSGGQQQMVNIGRALMTSPRLLLMDEPSQGLAPRLVTEIFTTIVRLKEEVGLTILLVEQNAAAALDKADHVYVMHEGRMKADGPPDEIRDAPDIREAYLGL